MLKKKIIAAVLVIAAMTALTGCGASVGDIDLKENQSAIYIQEGNVVTYAASESFNKDYYDKGDLKDAVESEVKEFNNSKYASKDEALDLKSFKVKKDVATMILEFATVDDFDNYIKNFNEPEKGTFYIGSIENNEDCKITGKFYAPDDKDKLISDDKIKDMDAEILIVNEKMQVQVDGTIDYVSENCKISDGIVETTSADEGLSYIVYTVK